MEYNEDATVLRLLAEGWTVHEIATYLSRTVKDIKSVIRNASR